MIGKIIATAALLALVICCGQSLEAKVKKHTDEQGTLHITNVEPEGQAPGSASAPGTTPPAPRGRGGRAFPPPPPEVQAEPEQPENPEESPPGEETPPPEPPPPPA